MLPRIKKVEMGKIHIDEDIITEDFFMHPNGLEKVEKSNKIGNKEFGRMALHEPEVVVFGTGFRKKVVISAEVMDAAKKLKIDLHILSTPDALKKFQELARKGRKVVAHIHVGE